MKDPHLQALTRGRFLVVWLIPILFGGAVAFAPAILNDGDTFWHIAAGRWMIGHGAVPAVDPFSFTFAGRPWVAHEWLSEVALASAFRIAGWGGVMLLTAVCAGALAMLMGAWLLRWLPPTAALAALSVGLACVAPGLLARPHLMALPVAAFWTIMLLKARAEDRPPPLALALVIVVWANLHSSFIVGLAIAGALGLEACLDARRWSRAGLFGWAAFLAATTAGCLATPHGLAGLEFPLRVLGMKALPVITEWQPADFLKPSPLELALLAGLFAAFWRGVRLTAVRALLLLGLVHMSLQHVRQEALLGALAPLLLAGPMGRALGAPRLPSDFPWRISRPEAGLAAILLLMVVAGRLVTPQVRVDGPTAPISALAFTPAALRTQPVLNDYDFGGYLIFAGVRPYIDGRADMYGDDFVADDAKLQSGSQTAIDRALARWRFGWAILRADRPLTTALGRTPGWRRIYADRFAVVLVNAGGAGSAVRPSAPPPAAAPPSSVRG